MVEKETFEPHLRRTSLAGWVSVIVLCLAALLIYFFFDDCVFSWFRDHPSTWQKNILVDAIRMLGNAWILIWLLLNWVCATGRQRPAMAGLLALLLIFPTICILKPLVHRPRPREVIAAVMEPEKTGNNNSLSRHQSFPSGDAATVFAVAAALVPFVRWPGVLLCFILASFVGFMRVAVLAHYPSDVCAGAALGVFCGWAATKFINKYPRIENILGGSEQILSIVGILLIPSLIWLFQGPGKLKILLKVYLPIALFIYVAGWLWKSHRN